MRMRPRVRFDSKTRAKPKVQVEFILLINLFGLLKFANIYYIDFWKVETNAKLFGRVFS